MNSKVRIFFVRPVLPSPTKALKPIILVLTVALFSTAEAVPDYGTQFTESVWVDELEDAHQLANP